MPGFMVVILIGAAAGSLARLLYSGPNATHGFLLTCIMGIAGAVLATILERDFGIVGQNRLADPISIVGASVLLLFAWNRLEHHIWAKEQGMHSQRRLTN